MRKIEKNKEKHNEKSNLYLIHHFDRFARVVREKRRADRLYDFDDTHRDGHIGRNIGDNSSDNNKQANNRNN